MAGNIIELIFSIGLITTIAIVLAPLIWVIMIAFEKFYGSNDNK
jgi:hypothetical protein